MPLPLHGLGLRGGGESVAALMQRQRGLEGRFTELLAEQRALRQHPNKASQLANQASSGPCPGWRSRLVSFCCSFAGQRCGTVLLLP